MHFVEFCGSNSWVISLKLFVIHQMQQVKLKQDLIGPDPYMSNLILIKCHISCGVHSDIKLLNSLLTANTRVISH